MRITGFYKDISVEYTYNATCYTSDDSIDDYFEIIRPENNENFCIVLFFKECQRVKTKIYECDDFELEKNLNHDCKEIYNIEGE